MFTGETYVTANVYDRIRDHLTGNDMAAYIRSSNDMEDRVFDMVNWDAIGRYMKGMPISKQVKICKYMHICITDKIREGKNRNSRFQQA